MNKKATDRIIIILTAMTAVGLLIVFKDIPQIIPTNWGIDGQVKEMGNKNTLWILFAAMVGVNLMFPLIALIDPKKENIKKFSKTYNVFRIILTVFFMLIISIMILSAMGNETFSVNKILPILVGILFIIIGNYSPKFKHNYSMGMRTIWTLASENVWNKTHRMAGPVWVIGGLLIVLSSFIFKGSIAYIILFVILATVAIIPTVYSYVEYNKEKKEDK